MAKTKTRTAPAKRTAKARAKRTPKPVTAIAIRPAAPGDEQMTAIERFVLDPRVDVEKLERVIALQERARTEGSRVAYFSALSTLQARMPKIGKRGKIHMKGGSKVRNRYAKMGDDILPVIKPLLAEHGFSIRWRTGFFVDDGKRMVRVTGILSHNLGWSEESVFEAPPDIHDSRNYVQSLGSTISYGHRYTMVDLLNLEMADDVHDDDGQAATGQPPARPQPKPTKRRQEPKPQQRPAASPDVVVSDAQLKRLYTIAARAKREKNEIKSWLAVRYNIDTSKHIRQADYDGIVIAIEAPGPLEASGSTVTVVDEREPGEEG